VWYQVRKYEFSRFIYQITYWLNKTADVYYLLLKKLKMCPLEKIRGDGSAGYYEGRDL
jgi:hypothetical protein